MSLTYPSLLRSGLMLLSSGLGFTIRSGFDRLAIFSGSTLVDTTLGRATFFADAGLIAMITGGLFVALAFKKTP